MEHSKAINYSSLLYFINHWLLINNNMNLAVKAFIIFASFVAFVNAQLPFSDPYKSQSLPSTPTPPIQLPTPNNGPDQTNPADQISFPTQNPASSPPIKSNNPKLSCTASSQSGYIAFRQHTTSYYLTSNTYFLSL